MSFRDLPVAQETYGLLGDRILVNGTYDPYLQISSMSGPRSSPSSTRVNKWCYAASRPARAAASRRTASSAPTAGSTW